MKRLLPVALGAALGVFATAATAAPRHIPSSENPAVFSDGGSDYTSERRAGRSAARQTGRHAAARSNPRHASKRSERRHAVTAVSRQAHGYNSLGARSLTSYASPGTSRGCLTSAARGLLSRIESQFGRVQVVSTCRPGARIAGTGRISRHASGNAVDFNAPAGRKAAIVRWLIANHHSGGTMTYSGMSHIHVDIGPRFVSLNSGRGG